MLFEESCSKKHLFSFKSPQQLHSGAQAESSSWSFYCGLFSKYLLFFATVCSSFQKPFLAQTIQAGIIIRVDTFSRIETNKVFFFLGQCLLIRFEICRELNPRDILQALRDETMNDPRERIEIGQSHAFYRPSLLGQP